MRLKGIRTLVTGASRGLGLAVAKAFADEGASVTIVAEDAHELEGARRALAVSGADVRALCVDFSRRTEVLDLCRTLEREADAPDVLVNNAAVLHVRPLGETPDAIWDETLAVNLTAPFLLIRALAPRLAARGGSVINVSSRAGVVGFADEIAYCAAKFGIEGLTRAAAQEWRGRPVSVNTITPGARIKPTGVRAAAFEAWSAERRAPYDDPVTLGPAFVLLATLRGRPTGGRFDAQRLATALASDGFEPTVGRLAALAESEAGESS